MTDIQTEHQVEVCTNAAGTLGYPGAKCSCGVSFPSVRQREQVQPVFDSHLAQVRHDALFSAGGTLIVRPHPQATTGEDELRTALAPAITLSAVSEDGTHSVRVFGEAGLLHARNVLRYYFWHIEREIPSGVSAPQN